MTRGDIIDRALGGLALANDSFTTSAEEDADAFRRLDDMMATQPFSRVPYNRSDDTPMRSDDTALPNWSVEGIAANLALRIASTYGATPRGDTRRAAQLGLAAIDQRYPERPKLLRQPLPIRGAGDGRVWARTLTQDGDISGSGDDIDPAEW